MTPIPTRTQVAIIGGGPAGLLLARLLMLDGIDCVVLERRPRDYVLARIRAGVLEDGLQGLLRRAGVGDRMDREGLVHEGFAISHGDDLLRIDLAALTGGRTVRVYGQTEVTRDLYAALDAAGAVIVHEALEVTPRAIDSDAPFVTWTHGGRTHRIECDVVAGCDGFHGVTRPLMLALGAREYERAYPFGWLGILADVPPVDHELIYGVRPEGFFLCSMRSASRSRYYLQVPAEEDPADWPDDRFWAQLAAHLPPAVAGNLVTGPSIEKSVAPLRSYVLEPMGHGRLLLAGDAAHIVPPTGAKGLNLAASDIHYLSRALVAFLARGEADALGAYSEQALRRVWRAERFSWWMTTLLHRFPEDAGFGERMKRAEFDQLVHSDPARRVLAENYVGLPY